MTIFDKIKDILFQYKFRKRVGLSYKELQKIFIYCMGRDDDEYVKFKGDIYIKNNVIRFKDYYISVGGNYCDASDINVLAGVPGEQELVFEERKYPDFIPGRWQDELGWFVEQI